MGALRLVLLVLLLAFAAPAKADPVDRWSVHIAEASGRFGIPEGWIRRVMQAESGGRTTLRGRPIVSHAGAMGLMQLMPGTWQEMRSLLGLGSNPHDPRDNVLAGTAYLRMMYDRFGHPGLFAAYNAGPARYAQHLSSGRRLPGETVAYISAVALLVWQRIVFPDGSSIQLDNLPATDASGYAGVADRVDFHSWRLLRGIGLSTLLGVGTQLTFGNEEADLVRALRESTQANADRAGQRIVERNLDIQPTIRVRPGFPVRVLVHKDLVLAPWRG